MVPMANLKDSLLSTFGAESKGSISDGHLNNF